jgi:hypothetical protein
MKHVPKLSVLVKDLYLGKVLYYGRDFKKALVQVKKAFNKYGYEPFIQFRRVKVAKKIKRSSVRYKRLLKLGWSDNTK